MIPTPADYNNNPPPNAPPQIRNRAALNTSDYPIPPQVSSNRIEMEVQVLNHCFDDIEAFVTRLQATIDSIHELEKRQKHRKSKKKHLGDGILALRTQLPQTQSFIDIFQKFKLSFNLLARLKTHIHDPNAPELVHFLFNPLALIADVVDNEVSPGSGIKELSKKVWLPLISRDAKELLLNCLTSKEQDLWVNIRKKPRYMK